MTALLALATLLGTGEVISQQPAKEAAPIATDATVAELRQGLASDQPATVAWSAYRAATRRVKELQPDLRRTLTKLAENDVSSKLAWRHRCLVRNVVDALIRIDAQLKSTELAPWFHSHPIVSIALASNNPAEHAGLLLPIVQAKRTDVRWLTACNLLLSTAPEALVAELISGLVIQLQVTVVEPNCFGSSDSIGFRTGCGSRSRPDGFPPVIQYRLHTSRTAQAPIARGPISVSLRRSEQTATDFGTGSHDRFDGDRTDYALRCLYRLNKEGPQLRSCKKAQYEWGDADGLRALVQQHRDSAQRLFGELLADLHRRGLCSKNVASSQRLQVAVELLDMRNDADKKQPLPDFGAPSGGE
ncbi:MAG: hypothetical protein AB8H80_04245 [Planctomycetota bacterium]